MSAIISGMKFIQQAPLAHQKDKYKTKRQRSA
jgi:hypothetical protein